MCSGVWEDYKETTLKQLTHFLPVSWISDEFVGKSQKNVKVALLPIATKFGPQELDSSNQSQG